MKKYIAIEFLVAPVLVTIGIFAIPFIVWAKHHPKPEHDRVWALPPLPEAPAAVVEPAEPVAEEPAAEEATEEPKEAAEPEK